LDVENHSKNVETKFYSHRISIDEVINVNFLLFRSIFFIRLIFAFLLFLCDSTLYSKRDDSDSLEMEVRNCCGTREMYAVARLLPVLQFYTCLIY